MISSKRGNKISRVKVAVRCRPAFQDEIDFAKGEFFSIVEVKKEEPQANKLGQIALMTMSGKTRDFYFDYAFGEETNQDQVYDRLARPVVSEVLKGCNGTIFAYGQTGTGKTYTMGILDFVNNEHAGLIPRATHQIFEYIQKESNADINVSISFLQLYRETIQDLLSPASSSPGSSEENLAIREDPIRGFYVEGLQEFAVRSYGEAEALINLGLENRAIAPTLMNATSSRSHIVLTVNLEQKIYGEGSNYTKTLRSKLLMVDLAGSERVRRTISKGTRLSEAKSINTSLSALGNVIAALAEPNATHIPYRDSKLTRLLQDSLGGTASTALIATIGPAAVNYGETLSTLLFAQRCMAVKITPIPHEEVDYAEMCAKLQAQLNSMEGKMTEKLVEQQELYETTIRGLHQQLEEERLKSQQQEYQATILQHHQSQSQAQELFTQELYQLLSILEKSNQEEGEWLEETWLRKPAGWSIQELSLQKRQDLPNGQLVTILAYSYELIKYLIKELSGMIDKNLDRDELMKIELEQQFVKENEQEKIRIWEREHMYRNDPRRWHLLSEGIPEEDHPKIGSHLSPLSTLEALTRVEGQFRSNNLPISQFDRETIVPSSARASELSSVLGSLYEFESIQDIAVSLINVRSSVSKTLQSLHTILERKDHHYQHVKTELTNQLVEKRKREEEVINWSYILKYLLASASKLRKELNQEKRIQSKIASTMQQHPRAVNGTATSGHILLPMTPGLEDLSMQSDIDKMSLNESIIHKLEDTILGQFQTAGSRSMRQGSDNRNEQNFIPFTENQRVNHRAATSSPKKDMHDETMSMASDAPRTAPPKPLHDQRVNQNRPLPNTSNNEALERVKLRLQMTKEELQRDPGPQPPRQHPSLANHYPAAHSSTVAAPPPTSAVAQRSNSMASVQSNQSLNSMSKLFNPEPETPPTDFSTPYDYSMPSPSAHSGTHTNNTSTTANRRSIVAVEPMRVNGNSHRGGKSDPRSYSQDLEEEGEDYDDERYSVDDSEYSLTSTTRSFRSAATPNSIPLPRYRKSKKKEASRLPRASDMLDDEPLQDEEAYYESSNNGVRSSRPSDPRSAPPSLPLQPPFTGSRGPPSLGSNSTSAAPPSVFAQEIARNLGLQGPQALSVMSVIDRVKDITPEQLEALDEDTRNQIVTIRRDLGIEGYILSNQQRRMNAEMHHIERTRSSSNPRSRGNPDFASSVPTLHSNPSSRPTSASRSTHRSTTPNQRAGPLNPLSSSTGSRPSSREHGSRITAPSLGRSYNSGPSTRNNASQSPLKSRLQQQQQHHNSASTRGRQRNNRYDDDAEEEDQFSQVDLMYRK